MIIFDPKIRWWIISIPFLMVLFILLALKYCNKQNTVGNVEPVPIAPVKTIKDVNGNLLAIIRSHEIKLLESKLLIDSLSHALKVKAVLIKTVDRYIVRTDTVVNKEIIFERSADSVVISKKDNFLELLAVGKDSGLSYFNLHHIDTIYRITVNKTPIFKKPYTDIYLRSASPYNRIVYGDAFHEVGRRPILTVGPGVGYGIGTGINAGISIQFPIFIIYGK
ncbi:hypothetical protein HGH93_21350 [Chitinophaga polysaccharea]|uniref:hypothetical protein n=1 Tax=Chitinophaga polysaccharea TaxID=1293035 RepID=UPI001455BA4F|nr:hypothetical protein [Chitinophaga polysaccharea]NLR60670.1 hypothetical protein [Chitinophaga polysaccharea]